MGLDVTTTISAAEMEKTLKAINRNKFDSDLTGNIGRMGPIPVGEGDQKLDSNTHVTYRSGRKTIESDTERLVAMVVNNTTGDVEFLKEKAAEKKFHNLELGLLEHTGYSIPARNLVAVLHAYSHTPGAEADNADGKKAGQGKQVGDHQKR